jgi:UDP-N-acetylglucosamine--N-acetylmuramyl-(pentapeptide) pyrophosphoryl-undecaprenol N-acetylglucosamine transferase
LVCDLLTRLSTEERAAWQFIHLAGTQEAQEVRQRYDASGVPGWVASHVVEVDYLYQLADVVIARAGAATIAELARSGRPVILVPYSHAAGHQRDNAALVESVGGGVMMEEADASAPRVLGTLRRMAQDARLRQMMATQMRLLARPQATERLALLIEIAASGVVHA